MGCGISDGHAISELSVGVGQVAEVCWSAWSGAAHAQYGLAA